MRVAIPRYGGRISPRFGFTQDILVVDANKEGVQSREVLRMEQMFPHQVPALLYQKGVKVVLTGGMNHHFQSLFQSCGIDVIWGLIGTPEEALEGFFAGKITPGMGCCAAGRQRRRHRGGAF